MKIDMQGYQMSKSFVVFLGLLIFLSGCSTVELNVEPSVSLKNTNMQNNLSAKIIYDGNLDYLPKILAQDNSSQDTVNYEYEVKYINGSTKYDALNLWNPLVMVGFPLSHEAVIVDAKLVFTNKLNQATIFTSSCVANKTRNLFQNSGSTEPRRKCLYAVRDNINNQVIQFIQGGFNADK